MAISDRTSRLPILVFLSLGCTVYTECPRANPSAGGMGNGNGGNAPLGGMNGSGGNSGLGGSPAPDDPWVNVTHNLIDLQSVCGNLSIAAAKPDEDLVMVGVAANGLWVSSDDGKDWQAIGQGKGSDAITNTPVAILFDPEDASIFWETGSYGPGVFRTSDNGETFDQLGDITHVDHLSVDFSDPDRRTLLATGHENGRIFRSTDSGETWADIELPSGANICASAFVVDSETYLVGCGPFGDGMSGIFRTENGGSDWRRVSEVPAAGSLPRVAADGALYWSADLGGGVVKSTDAGMTWQRLTEPGVVSGFALPLPDGRLAALGYEYVMISEDDGKQWRPVTSKLPFTPNGLMYSLFRKAFYVWHSTCEGVVPEDGIMRYDFDDETE